MANQSTGPPLSASDATSFCCTLCQRIFDKQSTFKRHGYYCRSRPLHQRKSRKRACSVCVQTKVRCDSQTPSCSRCRLRNLECVYQGLLIPEKSPDEGLVISSPQNIQAVSETSNALQGNSEAASNPLSTVEFPTSSGGNKFDWGTLNGLEVITSLPAESSLITEDWNMSMLSTSPHNFTLESANQSNASSNFDLFDFHSSTHPSTSWSINWSSLPGLDANAIVTIPPSLSATHLLRSFTLKTTIKPESRVSAMLLIQILKSYPKMMMRKETFPPFIHLCCVHGSGCEASSPIPETLANCMSLAQLFYRDTGGRKLLWRMIRLETERLLQEHPNFDKWELLASVQALMIYTLMRLVEGPSENTNFDAPLLSTVLILARALMLRHNGTVKEDMYPSPPNFYIWKHWLYQESRRRTQTIFRLLSMIFDLAPTVMCSPAHGFLLMPLPASKLLWEAKTAEAWNAEVEVGTKSNGIFGLSPDGQLMRLVMVGGWETEKVFLCGQNWSEEVWKSEGNWTEWVAGMDTFGYLIVIAASLVGFNG